MNNEEIATFEDRTYLSPTKSRDEQLSFVDNLRETMGRNTAQINADTYALGTQVPSNLGGLGGAGGTFTARYQTPQLNQTAADLRTAAQQSALNQALSNLQNAYKQRYTNSMLNYQQRAAAASNNNNGNGTGDDQKLPINTNNTLQDLGVRLQEEAKSQFINSGQQQFNEMATEAAKLQQQNDFYSKNTVPFSYVGPNGQTIYGNIYRDTFGNITGVRTPTAEYNGANGKQWLLEQARKGGLKNSAGQTMTDINVLFTS